MSLLQRIDILFGVAPVDPGPVPPVVGAVADQVDDSPNSAAATVEPPDITEEVNASLLAHFGNGRLARAPDPPAAVDAWLNTPNPTFGGCCPRAFLNGTKDQKAFLDGVLSSFEDGAFS